MPWISVRVVPARGDCCSQLLLEFLDGCLVTFEVAHDVAGDLLALVVCRSRGPGLGEQGRGLSGVEAELGSART